MHVESLHPVIPNFDPENGQLEVYISEKYWGSFKAYREWIERISSAISIDVVLDFDNFQQVPDCLIGWASATVGPLQIRLTLLALSIYTVINRVVVSGYRVVSGPGFPESFPITFGDSYRIKTIE